MKIRSSVVTTLIWFFFVLLVCQMWTFVSCWKQGGGYGNINIISVRIYLLYLFRPLEHRWFNNEEASHSLQQLENCIIKEFYFNHWCFHILHYKTLLKSLSKFIILFPYVEIQFLSTIYNTFSRFIHFLVVLQINGFLGIHTYPHQCL